MKFLRTFASLFNRSSVLTRLKYNRILILHPQTPRYIPKTFHTSVFKSENNNSAEELEDLTTVDEELTDILQDPYVPVKHSLYPNSKDDLIFKLNNCASLTEVFDTIENNFGKFKCEHITQTVLVIWDLQRMYFHVNVVNLNINSLGLLSRQFAKHLEDNDTFTNFLKLLIIKLTQFDIEQLSNILYYLYKLDLKRESDVLQLILNTLDKKLDENVSLAALSRFMYVKFSESSKGAYFCIADYLPMIFESIDYIASTNELGYLTSCLNNVIDILDEDILFKYRKRLNWMIDKQILDSDSHHTLLKALLLLSNSKWCDLNLEIINKCMKLFENCIHLLSLNDLLLLYDVFQKNQEPAFLMNELHRCTSRYFHQLEDSSSTLQDVRLKLLVALSSHCAPQSRPSYNNLITNLLKKKLSGTALFDMYKLLLIMKSSNNKLNKSFWEMMLMEMIKDEQFAKENLIKICTCYITFYQDVSFRHYYFETKIIKWLENELANGYVQYIPTYFAVMASFLMLFCKNNHVLTITNKKLLENASQFGNLEYYMLAKSISISKEFQDIKIPPAIINFLNSSIAKPEQNFNALNLNIKTALLLDNMPLAEELCQQFADNNKLTSKSLKNMIFCFYSTDVLIPQVMDNLCEYVIKNKDNVLGYNAEKLMFLCYHFAYSPKSGNKFFNAIIDIILRDQERMTGLAYIKTCLSLCYFHQLPDFFTKHIFNESFLEKLDVELTNCYYKDKYPIRVRHRMMQLNRAVCLDYPESNVPWFHQKYIEETKTTANRSDTYHFTNNVKLYLSELNGTENIVWNVITPYGYLIDFTIDVIGPQGERIKTAVLLLRPGAHSKHQRQIKGPYLLKMRHLEILGFNVVTIDYEHWSKLLSGEEKLTYLKQRIWSEESFKHTAMLS